jgi:hypothetical protein
MRQRAWIILRIRRALGEGLMAGGAHKLLELPVCHRRAVDPETVDSDAMDWRLFGVMVVRSHAERAAWDPDHVLQRRLLP